jgi:CheY-like chemotaxis protein/anti-sigma regulatory factor (Ser/Thr protein kinase)
VTNLVASAVDASHSLLSAAGIELENNSSEADLFVDADPDRLVQVISNLLSNAAKFTTHGGRIDLEVARQGQHVLIQVSDTGIGIPEHELERIFEPFTQVDARHAPTQGGLGIGLSLVRDLVHMHGGTVAAQSDGVGKGSTFIVRLPLAGSNEGHHAKATQAPTLIAEHSHSQRILVVDDSPDAAQSLAMLLEIDGHEVHTASNGVEAIEQTATFQPDVIFMDVGMPVMDGMEAARRIRHSKLGSKISIVALTGWGQEADRDRTREAGMDHHLVKPVSADDLRAVLRSVARSR